MDGLADQLQRTRVRSPALPAGDAEASETHLANLAEARERSDLAGYSTNPVTGSPARNGFAGFGSEGRRRGRVGVATPGVGAGPTDENDTRARP